MKACKRIKLNLNKNGLCPFSQMVLAFFLREGSQKKNVKVWSLTKLGGGSPETKLLLQKKKFSKIDHLSLNIPIHKEIFISAVLVINSLCGDQFLIA